MSSELKICKPIDTSFYLVVCNYCFDLPFLGSSVIFEPNIDSLCFHFYLYYFILFISQIRNLLKGTTSGADLVLPLYNTLHKK